MEEGHTSGPTIKTNIEFLRGDERGGKQKRETEKENRKNKAAKENMGMRKRSMGRIQV